MSTIFTRPGSYLAVWAFVGVAVYALYRPHGSVAAGVVAIAAGAYEFTPFRQHCRRRCGEGAPLGSGSFGLQCVGSSIGLMLVALGATSVAWMSVIAVLVLAQKAARESRQRCAAGPGDRRT
jgi:predicted metal-binding membrane protein